MTDQQRSSSGYRGALPPAQDRLARPWVLVVIGLFVLMFVLAFLGVPSGLTPDATPFPSVPVPSGSGAPSAIPSS